MKAPVSQSPGLCTGCPHPTPAPDTSVTVLAEFLHVTLRASAPLAAEPTMSATAIFHHSLLLPLFHSVLCTPARAWTVCVCARTRGRCVLAPLGLTAHPSSTGGRRGGGSGRPCPAPGQPPAHSRHAGRLRARPRPRPALRRCSCPATSHSGSGHATTARGSPSTRAALGTQTWAGQVSPVQRSPPAPLTAPPAECSSAWPDRPPGAQPDPRPTRAWPLSGHTGSQTGPRWPWGLTWTLTTTRLPRRCPPRGLVTQTPPSEGPSEGCPPTGPLFTPETLLWVARSHGTGPRPGPLASG